MEIKNGAFNRHLELRQHACGGVLISIENGLVEEEDSFIDKAYIIMEVEHTVSTKMIECARVPKKCVADYTKDCTLGEYLHSKDSTIDPKDWSIRFNNVSTRRECLEAALTLLKLQQQV